jgi:hypothetical protein
MSFDANTIISTTRAEVIPEAICSNDLPRDRYFIYFYLFVYLPTNGL